MEDQNTISENRILTDPSITHEDKDKILEPRDTIRRTKIPSWRTWTLFWITETQL